jgi:single-stranded-DNA-specific exonuclease
VVGIVASRLVQKFHRPAIVMGMDESGVCKGSCRSVDEFDLVAHLQICEQHLSRYGGHKMAAGVEVKVDELEKFRTAFETAAAETLKDRDLRPVQKVDAWVTLSGLSHEFVDWIERMEPFGLGNSRPVWAARSVTLAGEKRVVGANHVRCRFTDGQVVQDAIAFNSASKVWPEGPMDVAFQLQINRFHNKETLQMVVQDFRPATAP